MMKKISTDDWRTLGLILSVAYLLGLSLLVDRLTFGLAFIIW